MKFFEPTTVDEAVRYLAADPDYRCLAGGATLVAMMNAQLVEPTGLVSLAKVDGLKGIKRDADGSLTIGAMTLHQTVADSDAFEGGHAVVRDAARLIGHPAIRNMGTMGGSISHADAAADYPSALVAAGAEIEVASAKGRRSMPAGDFFVDYLETALEPGELVTAIKLPPAAKGAVSAYQKFARVEGDFATVSAAVVLSMDGGKCKDIRIAVGACAPVPVRVPDAEAALRGTALDDGAVASACEMLAGACDPVDDFRGSGEYRLMLVPVLVGRAIGAARARLEQKS
ncbi:MAG: FAD binding domain-containing protein [Candidatus Eiseniibacteriota bacterium]